MNSVFGGKLLVCGRERLHFQSKSNLADGPSHLLFFFGVVGIGATWAPPVLQIPAYCENPPPPLHPSVAHTRETSLVTPGQSAPGIIISVSERLMHVVGPHRTRMGLNCGMMWNVVDVTITSVSGKFRIQRRLQVKTLSGPVEVTVQYS